MTRILARWVCVLALAGLAAGCSSKATVSGKVTSNGKTVTSGSVSLFPSDNIQRAGQIGSDGSFSIPDVPTGTVKIVVSSPAPGGETRGKGKGDSDAPTTGGPAAAGWFPIPEKYGSPTTTDLTDTVKSPTTVLNIDLK
jgi:hypothetical protein